MSHFFVVVSLLLIVCCTSLKLSSLSMSVTSPKKVAIVGATGYIGKFVVQESIKQGYNTVAVMRESAKASMSQKSLDFYNGATILTADVTDPESLQKYLGNEKIDVVISCLASRSGTKDDSFAIDYQSTLNCLNLARSVKADQFILLSAICVRKPLLQFQKAKLKFEEALINAGDIKYSIVRPTAFFKSVSGQLELIKQGSPFVMFGDGEICKCNPIAESDLATYMINCIKEEDKWNKILDIGGPDEGMTMKAQGEMLFDIVKPGQKPWFIYAPVGLFDAIINTLDFFGQWSPKLADAAELARIGKYYAVEDMLTTKPSEKFGTITLKQHYERINVEGQEYDPYTTMLAKRD